MERLHIHFKERQIKSLKKLAKSEERTVADIVRDAVDAYLDRRQQERKSRLRSAMESEE